MHKPALFSLAAVLALAGCYHIAQLQARFAATNAPSLYAERCSTCHGPNGRGDGLGGEGLEPKPRDFADRDWQRSISDARIAETIHAGGAALGLSARMPAQPDLDRAQLEVLVRYIRSVGAVGVAAR